MANPTGNPSGPIYPLGKLTVAVVGTQIPVNTNVSTNDATGTPLTGVPGNGPAKGSPAPLKCNELKIQALPANTGNIFLIFKGPNATPFSAAGNAGCAVILIVPPGQERSIQSQQNSNPYCLDQFALDSDVAAQSAYLTAFIA